MFNAIENVGRSPFFVYVDIVFPRIVPFILRKRLVMVLAQRRMFNKSVVMDDDFYELSKDARLLYYSLGMEADDDGFLKSAKRICRINDIPETALDELQDQGFIFRFPSGVVCIVDWPRNNQLRKDRYQPTEFSEFALVGLETVGIQGKRYRLKTEGEISMATAGIPAGNQRVPQDSINQENIGEHSLIEKKREHVVEKKEIPAWMMSAFGRVLTEEEYDTMEDLLKAYGADILKQGMDQLIKLRQQRVNPKPYSVDYLVSAIQQIVGEV